MVFAMTAIKIHFLCSGCGARHLQWSGRCSSCSQWNTLEEVHPSAPAALPSGRRSHAANSISVVDSAELGARYHSLNAIPTGSGELDRAFGGGLVPGSVTLVGGEPGVGKSTLLTQFLINASKRDLRSLYVSAEESQSQLADRIYRLGGKGSSIGILVANDLAQIEEQLTTYKPKVVVIDSIQTVSDASVASLAGSVNQVRECASRLSDIAKREGVALIFVGHVTKDGSLAGPRVLEHLVDTVAYFEGDRDASARILRVVKHRFGPVGDLGMFEMGNSGLADLANATGFHLLDRVPGQAGSSVFPALDGRRVLLTEVQALVVPTFSEQARRVVTGFEANRLLLILAVLERKAGIKLQNKDVFLSVAGGVRLSDPAADLAVVVAIVSALSDRPVDPKLLFLGEVGLGGEIRSASNVGRRLSESCRLGFTRCIVGASFSGAVAGVSLSKVKDVREALQETSLTFR